LSTIKIAHATTVHARDDIRIFHKECRSLRAAGFANVSLIVADGNGDEVRDGVQVLDIGRRGSSRLLRAIRGNLAIWRELRRGQYDIVHVHDPELLLVATAYRFAGGRVVYDMHENLPLEIRTKEWIPAPFRGMLSVMFRFLQQRALAGVPTVFAEESYLQDFSSVRRSAIVMNFPILEELATVDVTRRAEPTIGSLGGISSERGADLLLSALQAVRNRGRPVQGLLVGPVADGFESNRDTQRAIADGWLELTGRLAPRLAWERIAGCHVGVALLRPSPNFVDSYPTKLFEYMALGIPVIVSDFPLWRGIVDHARCGLAVDPTDIKAIATAIDWLLDHPNDAMEMGLCGKHYAQQNYTWTSEYRKLQRLYSAAIKR
jgi:glycosyltransferase involved in cell wall biosynthesis